MPGRLLGRLLGTTCLIRCSGTDACRGQMMLCPADYACRLACDGQHACRDATLSCSADHACSVSCSNSTGEHACEDLTVLCGSGSCSIACGPSDDDPCRDTELRCGAGACGGFVRGGIDAHPVEL